METSIATVIIAADVTFLAQSASLQLHWPATATAKDQNSQTQISSGFIITATTRVAFMTVLLHSRTVGGPIIALTKIGH